MKQIISSRQFLFQREDYKTNDATGEVCQIVTDKLIVRSMRNPQNVPEWVTETDLFAVAVKDGVIVEVELAGASPNFNISNESKAGLSGAATPVASIANGKEEKTESKTNSGGWGS